MYARPLSPSPEPIDLPQDHMRSITMYDRMDRKGWNRFTLAGKHYLNIHAKNYRILDGAITEFNNEPLLSIGAGLSREIIVMDPSSPYLRGKYLELKRQVQSLQNTGDLERDINAVLECAMRFTRSYLHPRASDLEARINRFCNDPMHTTRFEGNPVISLDTFIKHRLGVCRHHGLFISYLLHNLVQDGLLPPGHVFHHRDNVQGGAHVWSIYKPTQRAATNYNFYLVDSLWDDKPYDVLYNRRYLVDKGYGQTAITGCITRYNKPDHMVSDLESTPYSALREADIKKDFITSLLSADPIQRRKILNRQYRMNSCGHIKSALISPTDRAIEYKNHENYNELLSDVDRVLTTEDLHNRNYEGIHNTNNRQQFVLGLLCKSKRERERILSNQSNAGLLHLHRSLITETTDRKNLYQQFDSYQDVVNATERLALLRVVTLIKDIILSQTLRVLSSNWTCCFYTAGERISTKSGMIRVPKCGKEIYDKINKVNIDVADVHELKNLINDIRSGATISAANNHSYRDVDTTQRFLNTLKDNRNTNDLLEAMQTFSRAGSRVTHRI